MLAACQKSTIFTFEMKSMTRLFFRTFLFLLCVTADLASAWAERVIVPVEGGPVGNSITALLQDGDGFMWVGTISGLMRYDMHSYRYFGDCDGLPLSRTMIRNLTRDDADNIWIGTEYGALVYNPVLERFRRIGGRIAAVPVKTITCTSRGTMLLTAGDGVAVVDPSSLAYSFISGEQSGEHLNNILATTVDTAGNIWGWSHGRLSRFDFSGDPFSPRIDSWPFAYEARALAVDSRGRLWFNDRHRLMMMPLPGEDAKLPLPVAIRDGIEVRSILIEGDSVVVTSSYDGIHRFHIEEDGTPVACGTEWIDPDLPNEVSNSVLCVERDRMGNYWFGTVDGIYVSCERPREIFHNMSAGKGVGLIHNVVSDVCLGPDGAVWAATSGGLDCIRRRSPGCYAVEHFKPHLPAESAEMSDRRFQTLAFDSRGTMWIGTKRMLLFFDTRNRRFFERREVTGVLARCGALFSKELCCDSRGNVWMGFIYGGLFVYDAAAERCRTVRFAGKDLYDASPQAILEDAGGNVWVGTKSKGLLRFRPDEAIREGDTLRVGRYDTYFLQDRALAGFISINALHAAADGTLYVGTSHGLYRYDAALDRFEDCSLNAFGEEVWVLNIIADTDGVLWVSTMQGVYRYTPDAEQAPFYELSGGAFARLDYNLGSCLDTDGMLFVGGINGITYFEPQQVERSEETAKVYVSGVSVLNRDIVPDGVHLDANINRSHRLTLNYDDYQLSLDFTTLTFSPAGSDRFYYKIDGMTPDWIPLDVSNRLSFSNLARGEYMLRVKAADVSGVLSEGSTDILITVLPPWWLTWWAYCIYCALALLLAAAVVWVILIRYRAAQQVRMVQYKQQLFINLTHGLKTPLTMMQVPLQLMSDDREPLSDEARRGLVAMVSANVKKLANTVRQLMEFRKIDQNRVSMNLAEVDIVEYVRRICDYFRTLFDSKGLKLVYDLPDETIVMTFDPEKIELALYNLLQNAYTFTHPGGEVSVDLRRKGMAVCIAVRDTGIGIRPEHLGEIFSRFWQVHETDTMPPLGTGIGLTVAREFVEMHNGRIEVESCYGTGSTFTICLPLETRYNAEQYYIHKSDEADEEQILPVYTKQYAESDVFVENDPGIEESKPNTVYVLAGGGDITGLVRMVLSDFNVLHYSKVEDTIRAVRERRPQLILIDIVVYDREEGLRLCRRLKGSKQTDDIPVVLFTADDTPEDARIFCEAGVDAWMEKPFDVELFRARVRQLVNRHADLQQKLKIGQILGKREDIVVESADEKFMSRVTKIVEQNIPNEEFSLEVFAREMRVSRSVLNMRIQNIVGKSPMELLRNARMQRAAQLLETNAYDVAQVGYMVGFSDPRYFSTSFKKQFGVSPRAYMQNYRNA